MVDPVRDDRVLGETRVLAAVILPFLVVAFVLLYLFPGDTASYFAWSITSTMTPMVLASAYLGGAYFFVRALRARHWAPLKAGFPAVALFAGILGVATVAHWEVFNHGHVAFWVWTSLYVLAPVAVVAVWVRNRRYAGSPAPGDARLTPVARWVFAATGGAAVLLGAVMVVSPATVAPAWPWALTPLTCRVIGSIFSLGVAGLVVLVDDRWTTVRLMVQVAVVMSTAVAVAAVRARDELVADRPLTWVMLAGILVLLVGSAALWRRQERLVPETTASVP